MGVTMQVSDFLRPENVIIHLAAPTKLKALQLLSVRAAEALGLSEAAILQPLVAREKLGSTGIGEGIAIPHTRIAGIDEPFGLVARLSKPLDFESIDELPVDIVFLLLLPAENAKEQLNALACAARGLRAPDTLRKIRQAATESEIYDALKPPGP